MSLDRQASLIIRGQGDDRTARTRGSISWNLDFFRSLPPRGGLGLRRGGGRARIRGRDRSGQSVRDPRRNTPDSPRHEPNTLIPAACVSCGSGLISGVRRVESPSVCGFAVTSRPPVGARAPYFHFYFILRRRSLYGRVLKMFFASRARRNTNRKCLCT